MTMPHLQNCGHQDDGWCLSCVKDLWEGKEILENQVGLEKTSRAIVSIIEFLRATEGSSVIIVCPNPDFNGLPDHAVEINNEETQWNDLRFTGGSLLEALRSAYVFVANIGKREFDWVKEGGFAFHNPVGPCKILNFRQNTKERVDVIWLSPVPSDYPSTVSVKDLIPD